MARAALGLTYRDIHAATGVAPSTLAKIGQVPVTPRIMQKLRKFFEGLGIGFARAPNGVRGVYFMVKPAPKAKAATVAGPSLAKRKLDEPFTPEANSVDFL